MYDPCTVAHEIKSPFRDRPSKFWPKGYRPSLITIWHVDPEDSRGMCGVKADDTCGWFSPPYSEADREHIKKLGEREYRDIFGKQCFLTVYRCYLRFNRPWYKHPRWHFWHWRFQVHPWQTFRRWAFSRCTGCGKRFPWGYSPISHQWHSPRPKLFRSEVGVFHSECSAMTMKLHSEPAKGSA